MRVVVLGRVRRARADDRLSEELGDDVDVVLIDRTDSFVFGFSKLEVMFGRATAPRCTITTPTS
jgi:sulfide:quinone oxidoreductase